MAATRKPKKPKKRNGSPGRRRRWPALDSGFLPFGRRGGETRQARFGRWGGLMFTFALLFLGMLIYFGHDLPDISKLGQTKAAPSITMQSAGGMILGGYGDIYGEYIPYDKLPKYLVNAIIATEDRNFFYHPGIDPVGLARAIFTNLRHRKIVQGGSTITQQVAKNVFLTPERTLKRKIQEAMLALWLEAKYSKEEILGIYANRVYLGAGNFGIDAAARRYFNKPGRQITLSEAAMLTGMLKAPSRYSPTTNPELARKRAEQVLLNMVDAGLLGKAPAEKAIAELKDPESKYDRYIQNTMYFCDWAVEQVPEYIGEVQEDIVVTTTLDPEKQKLAEEALNKALDEKGEELHIAQGALVSMKPDGAVVALVGGRNYGKSQFNRAVQAHRQPGSSFKLFVYLAGLEAGLTPLSQVEDQPITVEGWSPKNYGGKYEGAMLLRDAVAHSINTVAVQVSEYAGRDKVLGMAERLGITSELNPGPSVALGASEVNLLEMTAAYDHLAANGRIVYPYGIQEIRTKKGNKLLYKREPLNVGQVLQPNIVAMMNNMLIAGATYGTGAGAGIGRPIAGKTGTTQDYKDAWFIGFTPDLTTGVWVGNDDSSKMKRVTGGTVPAEIWKDYMNKALEGMPAKGIPNQTDYGETVALPWQPSAPSPVVNLSDAPPPAAAPGEAPVQLGREGEGSVQLGPSFWNKLFDGPDKGTVEYDYPSQKRR